MPPGEQMGMLRVAVRVQTGFTMVELMVALAVLAILTVIAAPSMAEYLERSRLRGAAEEAIAVLGQARQAAVEADRNVRLSVKGTSDAWCVGAAQAAEPAAGELVGAVGACDCSTAAASCVVGGERLVATVPAGSGVTVSAGSLATDFVYDSKGGTLANLASVPRIDFLSSSGRYGLRVCVRSMGQARACNYGEREIPGFAACTAPCTAP